MKYLPIHGKAPNQCTCQPVVLKVKFWLCLNFSREGTYVKIYFHLPTGAKISAIMSMASYLKTKKYMISNNTLFLESSMKVAGWLPFAR